MRISFISLMMPGTGAHTAYCIQTASIMTFSFLLYYHSEFGELRNFSNRITREMEDTEMGTKMVSRRASKRAEKCSATKTFLRKSVYFISCKVRLFRQRLNLNNCLLPWSEIWKYWCIEYRSGSLAIKNKFQVL